MQLLKENKTYISENLQYHLKHGLTINESVFRIGSKAWCDLIREVRNMYYNSNINLTEDEKHIIESDAGRYGNFKGERVPLDAPFVQYTSQGGQKLYGVFVESDGVVSKVDFSENPQDVNKLIREMNTPKKKIILREDQYKSYGENYMLVQNLKRIIKQAEEILGISPSELDDIMKGHQWAVDHVSTAADDIDEVNTFIKHRPPYKRLVKQFDEQVNLFETGVITKEDLDVWVKEKWVDVSRKVDGKHPPCGRKDADKGKYPKCRPKKKVNKKTPKTASSYSKKEKKSMTRQKRSAESKGRKSGTPNYTSYDKSKKKS